MSSSEKYVYGIYESGTPLAEDGGRIPGYRPMRGTLDVFRTSQLTDKETGHSIPARKVIARLTGHTLNYTGDQDYRYGLVRGEYGDAFAVRKALDRFLATYPEVCSDAHPLHDAQEAQAELEDQIQILQTEAAMAIEGLHPVAQERLAAPPAAEVLH